MIRKQLHFSPTPLSFDADKLLTYYQVHLSPYLHQIYSLTHIGQVFIYIDLQNCYFLILIVNGIWVLMRMIALTSISSHFSIFEMSIINCNTNFSEGIDLQKIKDKEQNYLYNLRLGAGNVISLIDYYNQIMDRPIQQLPGQPQLASLKLITSNINQCSILTILDIYKSSPETAEILLDIRSSQYLYTQSKSKNKNKQKLYKIKYDNHKKFQQVLAVVQAYPIIKAKIGTNNWEIFTQSFQMVKFKEIIIEGDSEQMNKNIYRLSAEQYRFVTPLNINSIGQFYQKIVKRDNKKILQIEFNVKLENINQIVPVVSNWCSLCNLQCQLQKLSLCYEGELLISLQNKNLYGISICLYKYSNNVELCLALLEIFVKNPLYIFVSIEFLDWLPSTSLPVNYVFANYSHRSKYLIKFGNYLEITQFRLFINTTGMKKNEVANIFDLMKHPGHYQLICHSNKQFFQQAIRIFLYKPLIQFKFFVPLSQSQQLQSPIEAMMAKADLLKKKLQVFMKMLKSPCQMDLRTILKLFLTMSKTNFN